ncbi:hypothetical protein SAMN05443999_10650 [Roseovarius azorensis]|uniref:Tetratricopeptide repeat-containing protein n=1 Tax=Roseovarius azorensis TaxID=1287727 RepID=A0A1H7R3B1_9RHOB|nr:hypothetical protein [Roseovarius azorensis]SEL54720.1 hypothetical protein SAMN05443999_10650 [Roseovarius azorensis]
MIARLLLALLFCLLGQTGIAQTVQIRSGDHEGFTRLVMTLPARIEWQTETREGGASLVFARPGLVFDTSRVFDRITRARLADIVAPTGQSRLDLSFACDCGLLTFWHDRSMLVVDISASADLSIAEVAAILQPRPQAPDMPGPGFGSEPLSRAAVLLSDRLDQTLQPDRDRFAATPRRSDPFRANALPAFDLADMRAALVRELDRAVTQGLLSSARPLHALADTPHGPLHPGPMTAAQDDATASTGQSNTPVARGRPNIRVQTGLDSDLKARAAALLGQSDHHACLPVAWVNVPAWGSQAPFYQQAGPLNRRLFGEFDHVMQDTAFQLARLYIYFGLGLEARQVLSLIDRHDREMSLLTDLAMILDTGEAPDGSILFGQVGCDAPVALWSLLAHDPLPEDLTFDHKAVQRGFAALPDHLRQQLGPVLARKLNAAGHMQTADGILRMIDRSTDESRPETALAEAELAQSKGLTGTAEAGLEAVIDSNASPSAEALLQLIEQRLAEDKPISFDHAQLAGAYAHEYRSTAFGQRMARAYVSALAASGAFGQAFSEFDRMRPDLTAQDQSGLQNILVGYLTAGANDLDFLRYTLANRGGAPQTLAPDLALAVSQRLLEAGFTRAAETYVSAPEPGPDGHAQRLLRANIALAQNRPRQAEVELLNVEGADVDALRARARDLAGEHGTAIDYFMASDQPDKAADSAWLAGDWTRLRDAEDPVMQEMADLLHPRDDPPYPPEGGVLARNRTLLEQSAQTRKTLGRLLEAKPVPQMPES